MQTQRTMITSMHLQLWMLSLHLSSSVEVMLTVSLPECSVLQMCCCCLEGLSNDVATTSTDLTSR